MPERGPLNGVYRRPYHRDPLVYVALVIGAVILARAVLRDTAETGWRLFEIAMAVPAGFVVVGFVGGFFRDPPSS